LNQKKDLLDYIAKRLIEVETMDSKEFNDIIKAHEHCEDLTASAKAEATETESASENENAAAAQTETAAEPAAETEAKE
jgi:cell division protease FtsH